MRAEDRIDSLTADVPDVMLYEAAADGRLTYVSGASQSLLGLESRLLVGRPVDELLSDSLASILPRESEGARSREGIWMHPDGQQRPLQLTIERLPRGGPVAFRGIARDVGDRVAAESALRETEQSFLDMLESAQNGILVVTISGRILLFNRAICDILGFEPEEVRDRTVDQLLPDATGDSLMSLVTARVWGGGPEGGLYLKEVTRPDGDVRHVEISISTYPLGNGERSGWLEISDITERRRATDRIQQLADYDHLTGLPNRQLMERSIAEVLEQARTRHGSFAVMLMDLDRFKLVNDTLGHTVGDDLLQQVAARFVAALPAGHMVARFGGDEFLVLVPSLEDPETAMHAAGALVQSLNSPLEVGGRMLHTATSVGVAVYPHDGEDAATLIRRADSAMYRAKELGGSGYQFATASLDADSQHRLNIENDLRAAIEAGELTVYYHPEVDIETGSIVSFEALVRWDHPDHGLLPPVEFIPILEENGLIRLVDEWVLREACEQSERWRADGLGPVIVSVNLSARLFSNEGMLDTIRTVVAETGVTPELLELEVTETAALQNVEDAVSMLKQINDLGVRTALDDFGTGHSSLVRLKEFPLDTLKIDGSFVQNVTTDEDAGSIVSGVIALGHALGLTVVAEGVEHERQLSLLRALGCDLAQGYLFARPLTAAAATTLLSEHRRLGYGFAA
jgi:diguanylate cyclase (GGDEF)-like protein/PAS domain S-box-containing protein